jgi:RNA polymerase sigma factor (sigma-70 family)
MSKMDLSPETQVLVDNFPSLKNLDNEVPDACWRSLLKIAEWGINSAAPGLTIDGKKELLDLAISALYEKLDELENGKHMAKRLWMIARNKTTDYIKRYEFKNTCSLQAMEQEAKSQGREIAVAQMGTSDTPQDALMRTETHSLVNVALERVGAECKSILVLKFYEDVTREELSKRYEIGIDAVDKRLQKCKAAWKKIYERISEMHSETKDEDEL